MFTNRHPSDHVDHFRRSCSPCWCSSPSSLAVASPASGRSDRQPEPGDPGWLPGRSRRHPGRWEGTRSAKVHWELTDTRRGRQVTADQDRRQGRLRHRPQLGLPERCGGVRASIGGKGTSASGGGSWDPAGIAQFNHLEVKVSNGTSAEGTECSVVRKIYNFSRLAYQYALNQNDKPYVLNTAGPDTFDCSGLVHFTYNRVLELPRLGRACRRRSSTAGRRRPPTTTTADLSNLHSRDAIQVSRSQLQIGT